MASDSRTQGPGCDVFVVWETDGAAECRGWREGVLRLRVCCDGAAEKREAGT